MITKFLKAIFIFPLFASLPLHANSNWEPININHKIPKRNNSWETIPFIKFQNNTKKWIPLSVEENKLQPDQLIWIDLGDDQINSKISAPDQKIINQNKPKKSKSQKKNNDLRWPNGQLMSVEDQIYYRSAWSRGSMVQIGDTIYPNIGLNALQRAPGSWIEVGVTAIDDSWQWFGIGQKPDECSQGNFLSVCADGLMENNIRIWSSPSFSAGINWTIHSLSGEGSPFTFVVGDNIYGAGDSGTKFGEGQSLGFSIAKNFGKTFGISIGGNRLWHLDETTDLSKPLYIKATKIFRLNDSIEPPIISLTLGMMSDVYNPDTMIGKVKYPDWLLGGHYRSLFAERYDDDKRKGSIGTFYPNVAGTSSAFICAEETIFSGKKPGKENKECIKYVAIAPIGSIGFAPWPWLGFYANFTRNLNLGISLKPFKELNWNISAHLISPIVGLNSRQDLSIERNRCPDDQSFSSCRTRIGIWTQISF